MIKRTLLYTTASALILMSSPTLAAEQMSIEEIQAQLKQLTAQVQTLSKTVEQQNQTIKRQEAELATQKQANADAIEQAVAKIQPAAGEDSNIKVTMNPAPKIESADGKYSFQPIARMHLDATHIDDDASDRSSGTDLRRARLGAKGKLGNDLSYKAEVDFGGDDVALTDFYLKYSGLGPVDVIAGHQRPRMGLQQKTSSNDIRILERAAPVNALLQGRRLGVNVVAGDDHWSAGLGAFGEGAGTSSTEDEDTSIEGGGSVNILGLLDNETENVLHLGAAYSHRRPGDNEARFRARPGTGDGPRIVDTGTVADVDTVDVYGLEVAGVFGPFSAQAEYIKSDVNRQNGSADADFDGYYVQAGYFVTGESRPYKGKSGKFGSVKPNNPLDINNGGWGALELVTRYENLDLNDSGAGITGGEVDMITGGFNWHLNKNVRIMGNVIDVDSDENAVVADDDPTVYSLRTQWNF